MGNKVKLINSVAVGSCIPDLTFYLRVEPDDGQGRINDRALDRIELQDAKFRQRTFDGYENIASEDNRRVAIINGNDSIENIHKHVVNKVRDLISDK